MVVGLREVDELKRKRVEGEGDEMYVQLVCVEEGTNVQLVCAGYETHSFLSIIVRYSMLTTVMTHKMDIIMMKYLMFRRNVARVSYITPVVCLLLVVYPIIMFLQDPRAEPFACFFAISGTP